MPYIKGIRGYQKVSIEQLRSLRRIPKNAIPIEEPGLGVVYVGPYAHRPGYFEAIAYAGNAHKPAFNYIYKKESELDARIEQFFAGLREWKKRVAERRAASNAGHSLKVGDIVYSSWGYDQTNVDFYRVTRTTKNFVWLREICPDVEQTGFMSGKATVSVDTSSPDPSKWSFQDTKDGKEEKHKAEGTHVSLGCSYKSASKWDGRPLGCSWYH